MHAKSPQRRESRFKAQQAVVALIPSDLSAVSIDFKYYILEIDTFNKEL